MRWIHALLDTAEMVQHEAIRDRPNEFLVGKTVGVRHALPHAEMPIALHRVTCPQPTVLFPANDDVLPESLTLTGVEGHYIFPGDAVPVDCAVICWCN